jgi:CYTH domain-containing protein
MEIERKFLIEETQLPKDLETYEHKEFEQGYLCTNPVVRARREGDSYVLTYKGGGLLKREEYNLPLDHASFSHLIQKADGIIIKKTRYFLPLDETHTIELDIFHDQLDGLMLAEIEFETEEEAKSYIVPDWFGREVTYESAYHNSTISKYGMPADLK